MLYNLLSPGKCVDILIHFFLYPWAQFWTVTPQNQLNNDLQFLLDVFGYQNFGLQIGVCYIGEHQDYICLHAKHSLSLESYVQSINSINIFSGTSVMTTVCFMGREPHGELSD